jgi:hypothetical protein
MPCPPCLPPSQNSDTKDKSTGADIVVQSGILVSSNIDNTPITYIPKIRQPLFMRRFQKNRDISQAAPSRQFGRIVKMIHLSHLMVQQGSGQGRTKRIAVGRGTVGARVQLIRQGGGD